MNESNTEQTSIQQEPENTCILAVDNNAEDKPQNDTATTICVCITIVLLGLAAMHKNYILEFNGFALKPVV